MKCLNKRGVALAETIASVVLITFVFITTITIIINARNQTLASKEEIVAVEVATRVRDNIVNNSVYNSVSNWMGSEDISFTQDTCSTENPPFSCTLLSFQIEGVDYEKPLTVVFYTQSTDDLSFRVINFSVSVNYYSTRKIEITGVIYEE
jgi:hypothetical protein